jgi:hypothetical protein
MRLVLLQNAEKLRLKARSNGSQEDEKGRSTKAVV